MNFFCFHFNDQNLNFPAKKKCLTYFDDVILFIFTDAQKLVEDMEKERRKLDKQLDLVQEKTKRAYLSQEILEAKMKVGIIIYVVSTKK